MDDESPHTRESTPVPPPETGPIHPAWDPKDAEPPAPSFPTVPIVEHMRILMKYISMTRRLADDDGVDIDELNASLKASGSSTTLKAKPEPPIIASVAWEEWALECFDAALAGNPRARPMPLPFLFRSHDELFGDLAKYRREGEGWFNVLHAARRQLGIPEPLSRTATTRSRPQLPDFVPNAVPSFGDDPSAPPLLKPDDAHLPSAPDPDPTAPILIRGSQYRVYATIPRQSTEDFGQWRGDVLFLSNVNYVPLPPRNVMPRRRKTGHFGPHELSRYAQWQEHGKYHLAFIPTCADGEVHKLVHRNLAGNMAWYDLDLENHCVDTGEGRYLISRELHTSLTRDWNAAQADYVRWAQLRGSAPGMPQGAFLRGKQSLGYLSHAQKERDLLETVAGFQRSLQEIRGWNNYQQCCSELRDVQRLFDAQGRHIAPSLGGAGARKPYRGVFTWSEDVAKRIAQFGVPVFLIAALRKDQAVDPNWRQVSFLTPEYERAVWDEPGIPRFLAGAQETRPLPPDDTRGIGEHADQEPTSGGFDDDDDGPVVVNYEPEYRAQNAGPTQGPSSRAALETSSSAQGDGSRPRKRKGRDSARAGPAKKAKLGDGSAPTPAEKEKPAGRVRKPRYPYKDQFAWPSWFPHPWSVAKAAVEAADHSENRWDVLYNTEDAAWRMNDTLLHGRELMAPQISMFARAANAGQLSRYFASYAALRGRYFDQAATTSPESMHRFSSSQWREIHKGFVHRDSHIKYGRVLGLYTDEQPDRSSSSAPVPAQKATESADSGDRNAPSAAPGERSSTPEFNTEVTRSAVIQFAPLGKPMSAAQETCDFDARCFVNPLPDGERVLATEAERYLHEPDGWRRLDADIIRPLEDFPMFLEDESPHSNYRLDRDSEEYEAGRYFLMRFVDKKSAYIWTEHHDLWWNYMRGWVLGFRRLNSNTWQRKPLGYLGGERLTKPLKFFTQAYQYGPKEYLYGTLEKPMRLRVWQSRPFHERLPIDCDPLGKVGCLTRCLDKFVLDAEKYERVHGIALSRDQPTRAPAADVRQEKGSEASASTAAAVQLESSTGSASPAPALSEKADTSTAFSSSTATVFKGTKPGKGAGRGDSTGWDLVKALTPDVFRFEHHTLPAYSPPQKDAPGAKDYEWLSMPWRRYLIWDAAELLFRFEIFALDSFLREAYPQASALTAGSTLERRQMVCAVWQGNGFLPSGPSPLTSSEWRVREPAVRALAALVKTWPRTSVLEMPENFEQASFEQFEREVWSAYAQTYTDYHWREAPFPCLYPNVLPF